MPQGEPLELNQWSLRLYSCWWHLPEQVKCYPGSQTCALFVLIAHRR